MGHLNFATGSQNLDELTNLSGVFGVKITTLYLLGREGTENQNEAVIKLKD